MDSTAGYCHLLHRMTKRKMEDRVNHCTATQGNGVTLSGSPIAAHG